MDPKACLNLAWNLIGSGDYDDAAEALSNYAEWRRRGGFEPKGGDQLAAELSEMLKEENQ